MPTWDLGHSAHDQRFLLQGSPKAVHLTSILGLAVNSGKHLPLDSLCDKVSDVIGEIAILPLTSTDLVGLPQSRLPSVTYCALAKVTEYRNATVHLAHFLFKTSCSQMAIKTEPKDYLKIK